MKEFKQGAELRLCKDDLKALLEYALNKKLFCISMDAHSITEISLRPNNKYVIRLTVEPKKPPSKEIEKCTTP